MKQRTEEWLEGVDWPYHQRQYEQVYRSTVSLADWLGQKGLLNHDTRLLDVCCGGGGNIFYLQKRFPGMICEGVELNPDLVEWGNRRLANEKAKNARLIQGDLFNLPETLVQRYDGILSLQTLSWFPEPLEPVRCLAALQSKWLAITSLFYPGPVELKVEVTDFAFALGDQSHKKSYYNVYSLPRIEACLRELGFQTILTQPFELDIDLPAPSNGGMGTYTRQLKDGQRLQFSGPLWMPWYFVLAIRS